MTSNTPFKSLFDDFVKQSFILSIVKFLLVQKTNSINDTFGTGTLIAIPSSFPLRSGIISPIDFDAPVDVGTIDCTADRALLGSL